MTCIEKLKSVFPDWTEEQVSKFVETFCPSDVYFLGAPYYCSPDEDCDRIYEAGLCWACWNRNIESVIPHEFEYISRMATEIDGEVQNEEFWKHHVEILDRKENKYTGKLCYKIIESCDQGYIDEDWHTEDEIRKMLESKMEG